MVYSIFLMNYEENENLKGVITPYDLIDRVMIHVVNEKNWYLVLHRLLYMKNQVSLMNFEANKQESIIRYSFQ